MNLQLVFGVKDRASFFSARWQRNYNPDLCFVSRDEEDIPLQTDGKVLESFPRSQHKPMVIEIGTKIHYAKADWRMFTNLVE